MKIHKSMYYITAILCGIALWIIVDNIESNGSSKRCYEPCVYQSLHDSIVNEYETTINDMELEMYVLRQDSIIWKPARRAVDRCVDLSIELLMNRDYLKNSENCKNADEVIWELRECLKLRK